jgi:hypothetical protein
VKLVISLLLIELDHILKQRFIDLIVANRYQEVAFVCH